MKNIRLIVLILLVFGLSGCGKTTQQTTLEFWTLQLNDFAPYIQRKITEYEALHPDIKIKWIDIPFSEGEKRTLSAVMSDDVPDVVNLTPSFSSTLQQKKVLAPIQANLENTYIEPVLGLCKGDDGYFAVPWYVTSSITIFNKKLFEDMGQESPPKNLQKMLVFGQKMQKNAQKNTQNFQPKYISMPNLAEDGKMLKIMEKQGVNLENFFDSEKTAQTYELYKSLYKANLIPKGAINQTHRDSLEKYMSGETAILEAGANFLQTIEQNAPNIYHLTDLAPQQGIENGIVDISLMNLVIPKKGRNPKQALDFALFITNDENQLEFCQLAPVLPSSKKALEDEFFKKESTLVDKGRKISAGQIIQAKRAPRIHPCQKQINEVVDFTTQTILLEKKSVQEGLHEGKTLYKGL